MPEPISEQELLERQIAADPQNPRHHFMLGLNYLGSEQWSRAVKTFLRVIELAPQVDAAYFNLGNAYFELQQFSLAVDAYTQAMRICPEWETARNIAKSLAASGQLEQAIHLFQQAHDRPELHPEQRAIVLRDLGFASVQSGDWAAAAQYFEQSFNQCPSDRSWECVLVACQAVLSGSELLSRSASYSPNQVTTRMIIEEARALQRLNEHRQALEKLVVNTQSATEVATLFLSLAEVHFHQGHLSEALGCVHNLMLKHPGNPLWASFWVDLLSYGSRVSQKRIFESCRRWYESTREQLSKNSDSVESPPQATPTLATTGSKEIAILINSQSQMQVDAQILPWLRHRDRQAIRVTVLCDHWGDCAWMNELRTLVDNWRPIAMWTDVGLANWLRQNDVAILVDSVGHGLGTRLAVATLCPSCTYMVWNYRVQTSGSDDVDFVLHDQAITNVIDKQYVSEKIVSPSGPAWCLEYSLPVSNTVPSEYESMRPVCFGFSGDLSLIGPESIDLWSMVLLEIPNSQFVARSPQWACEYLRNEFIESFVKRGVDRQRIFCESSLQLHSATQRLAQIDIFLDTAACNCLTGILDALSVGKLIVSLSGERPVELVSQALSGYCPKCIACAQSVPQFVQIASELANSVDRETEATAARQAEFLGSPLCRPIAYAQSIDQLLINLLESAQRA